MKEVSIIAAVMNRDVRARMALRNWLEAAGVREIVLVDWSSEVPLQVAPDPRVRVVRVEGEAHFILALALNLAASLATGQELVKMDIDYRVREDFFARLEGRPGRFHRGNNKRLGREDNERHLNGFLAVERAAFLAVGGFDERIAGYGMDDTDLYDRLTAAGLEGKDVFEKHGICHVPHARALSTANMPEKDFRAMLKRNRRQVAAQRPWTAEDPRVRWVQGADGAFRRAVD